MPRRRRISKKDRQSLLIVLLIVIAVLLVRGDLPLDLEASLDRVRSFLKDGNIAEQVEAVADSIQATATSAQLAPTLVSLLEVEETATPLPAPPEVSAGGEWWQVYFTDPERINDPEEYAGSLESELIARINAAASTIHIASFEFDLNPVAEALIAAHQRGVEVLWVTDDEFGIEADGEEGHGQFAMLEDAGIEVRHDGRSGLMHNKFWVFDGRVVWTGSANITANGIFQNNNNVIVIESPQLAAIYEREFQEMWSGEFGPTSPSTLGQQSLSIGGSSVQVLFASEDGVASRLLALVEGASDSIRFMAFSFTHEGLGGAMISRAQAGVDVSGIFEARGSETEFSMMSPMFCAGVPVRQDGNPQAFHHKVIVIDGETVVTGSFNFSFSADEDNDENVIVVRDAAVAQKYLQEFDRRWREGQAPEAGDIACE